MRRGRGGKAVVLCLGLAILPGAMALACGTGPDRQAFDWSLAEDAEPLANGLMLVAYSGDDGATVGHVAYHRVMRVLPGVAPDLPAEEAARFVLLVTEGDLGPLTYVVFREPLSCGTDLDAQGLPRRVWGDPNEDGVNGNERRGL
ncbi:hypothetical protein [Nitrospira sp. Kam-Ns4a]